MLKRLLLTIAALAVSVAALAQPAAFGTLTASGQTVDVSASSGVSSVGVQVSGTWVGTITFQATTDGSNWVSVLATSQTAGTSATTTTSNGVFSIGNPGFQGIRVNATAWTSGTANIVFVRGTAGGGGSGGGGGVVSATQGTIPWVVSGAETWKAGGSAPTVSKGFFVQPCDDDGCLQISAAGLASVNLSSNSFIDNTTSFTTASSAALVVGGVYQATPTTLTDGKAAGLLLNSTRALVVAPSSGTFATDGTVDGTIGTTGPQVLCDGNSAVPTAVTTGRPQYFHCNLNGQLVIAPAPGTLVQGVNSSAMTGTTSTSIVSGTASNYLYIQSCVVSNGSTTVSTNILLQDGSGGTTLGRIPAPAAAVATTGGGGATHTFGGAGLKVPTSGNALYAANETTGASTYITCNGYRSTVSY